tara:strand:+ start:6509 stop:7186 length:678 start_codon:yes stop_codon:yes gene_type:complete
MKSTAILIPARYESSRFPGKPLVYLAGMTMIERVYNTCILSGLDTYILTDDLRIFNLFSDRNCWIEETEYANGTERCSGALKWNVLNQYDKFINVQGDMPDVTVEMIKKTQTQLNQYKVSTVCTMMPEEEQNNPNSVKLVRGNGKCLWFGRGMTGYGDWHLGIYGYQREALESYPNLIGTREEQIEQLEQLRWLKNGWDIGVLPVTFNGIEINTPKDARKWNDSW